MTFLLLGILLPTLGAATQNAGPGAGARPVVVIEIKGAIGVGTVQFLKSALEAARNKDAMLLVIQLDTPGGLVSATREIIQEMLGASTPVAVYVAPSGARAASAGTYISYAAHFSAMAPGTHIGAATPIQITTPGLPGTTPPKSPDREPGKSPGSNQGAAMERKTVNDAVSYLRSLAELRGRNADWAEKAVRNAATLTASQALRERVIDVVASDISDLLRQLDGRRTTTKLGEITLKTANSVVTPFEAGWKTRIISVITDPNVALILMMIGIYGIIFEFWSPGLTGPGVVGAICLIIALVALSALPLNYAGVALILIGVVLMIFEAAAPGFGILGAGGAAAFAFGALFLFDPGGSDIDFSVGIPVVISLTATTALLIIGALGFLVRVRRRKVVTGSEQLIGLDGKVLDWTGGSGRVLVHGETWRARSDRAFVSDARVRIRAREGLTLVVEAADERRAS